ncbi:MAG: hypothetical protein WAX69_23645 [Victivallales bacterium]
MWNKTCCFKMLSVIICLAAIGTFRLTADDGQVLAKFDFEGQSPLVDWGIGVNEKYAPFGQWKPEALPCALKIDAEGSHAGQACVSIETKKGMEEAQVMRLYTGGINIKAVASEAGRVRVRFFVRTEGVRENAVSVSMLERDAKQPIGNVGGKSSLIAIPPSPSWTEIDKTEYFDSNTKSLILMFVFNLKEFDGGTIWLDDISVEQVK